MDWISSVPDDILILIVSRLSFKEAARTTILSHRWRHLWTHTPRLDFDGTETMDGIFDHTLPLESSRDEYIHWVDQVIEVSLAPVLDLFRVRFQLNSRHSHKIDNWVNFAMKRRTRELELACLPDDLWEPPPPSYRFPSCIIGSENNLKSLRLNEVEITSEDLTNLLPKCVLLEELDISGRLKLLTNLDIAPGPPLKLKRIRMICPNVQTITIAAPTPDLMSLGIAGSVKSLHIEYAPKLTDLSISGHPAPLCLIFHHLMHYCSQIQTLSLAQFKGWRKLILTVPLLPDMACLKHLTVEVYSFNSDTRLYGLNSLIKKAPSLQHLTIKRGRDSSHKTLKMKRFYKYCHPSLSVLEFRGFYGSTNDMELGKYLLSIAKSPEKLVINFRHACLDDYYAVEEPKELEQAINRALELREVMAPQVQLVLDLFDQFK